jgi:O-antigen ligase
MELFLVNLVAFLRPLVSMRFGESWFELLGVGLFGLAVAAMLITMSIRHSLKISAIDAVIVAFAIWCLAAYVIYFESARVGEMAKLLVPMLSYTLVKNVLSSKQEYRRLLIWIFLGSAVPVVWSVALIASGSRSAIQYVSYWTDMARWQGVYANSHNLGHSMALLLMTITTYVAMRDIGQRGALSGSRLFENVALGSLGIAAVYCLYQSQVRTAILGLLMYGGMYLYWYNKKLLVFGVGALALAATVSVSYWLPALVPESAMIERGIELDTLDIGSGRGRFWLNDIKVYAGLPIDQQLAGTGIGARGEFSKGQTIYGHSDWLEILTQTGLVGFVLFAVLQVLILRAILRISGKERYAFLSLFVAVNFMMASSNSYVWRIQVSQLYYMILAFIEVRPRSSDHESVQRIVATSR